MRLLNVYFFFDAFIRFFGFRFSFCFGCLHHCHFKTTPLQDDIIKLASGVTSHYIVLHPVTSRASRTSGLRVQLFTILGLSTIAISDSILAKDVALDCSKACIRFVHWSRHIYFTSWLDNTDEFRCSTPEIASITTMFWPFNYSLSRVCGLLASSSLPLVWNTANWIFDGSNR